MMNAMICKCLPVGCYLFLLFMASCGRKETSTSADVTGICRADEPHEGCEQEMAAKRLGFEAALWLKRISADSFEIRKSAGNATAVEGLRKTLDQLDYRHFSEDSRIEGVIITSKILSDSEVGGKLQIRHIPIIDGRVNVGDQSPIYMTPEMLLKCMPLEGQL